MKTIVLITLLLFVGTTVPTHAQDFHNPTATIERLYEHFDKGEIPEVLSLMDTEIEWNEAEGFAYAEGNPYIGPDAVLNGVFGRIGTEWDNFTVTDRTFYAVDQDKVLVTGYYNAVHKETTQPLKAQFAHLWWVRDGKIKKFQQYTDTHQWATAMKE
jgi:ketosteroid isomerase-like protein